MFMLSESLVVIVDSFEVFRGIVCCMGKFRIYQMVSFSSGHCWFVQWMCFISRQC